MGVTLNRLFIWVVYYPRRIAIILTNCKQSKHKISFLFLLLFIKTVYLQLFVNIRHVETLVIYVKLI